MKETGHPVLIFDGVCNLCNRWVQFVIHHDKEGKFLFAPLQSEYGQNALQQINRIQGRVPDSVILYYEGEYYYRSGAALRIAGMLSGWFKYLKILLAIPSILRDVVYDLIAKNRYQWFGKRDECMIPTPELKQRFLS